jgi:hypothetical protein
MNKLHSNSILLLSIFLGGVAWAIPPEDTANKNPCLDGCTLKGSDEFEGASEEGPEPATKSHAVGGQGWGNNPFKDNTDRTDNAQLDGKGTLWLRATKEQDNGNAHTSALPSLLGNDCFRFDEPKD